jgi:sodium/potassium-transporting ATPase subunit alpha
MDVPSLLVNTISVMVAFIPEGLPVCVTLALLLIAKRMAKSNVLVKELSTIETLSCVNVIASDKTGTLTQNKMFVAKSAVGLDSIDLDQMKDINVERSIGFNQLVACSALCNNASFEETPDKMTTPINNRKAKGDATDIALLKFSTEYQKFPNINDSYKILSEIPFNSKNKWMMKIVRPTSELKHSRNKISGQRDNVASISLMNKGPIGMIYIKQYLKMILKI